MMRNGGKALKRFLCASLMVLGSMQMAAPLQAAVDKEQNARRVLLLGVDGVQLSEMQDLGLPNIQRLNVRKAYTGGINKEASQQQTSSGAGWATILTGVWANKHLVVENSSGAANPQFPSIFKRLRDARPDAKIASVAHWAEPNTVYFRNDVQGNDLTLSGLDDATVTAKGVELIQQNYDLVFLHLDDPDHWGHERCFGSKYDESLRIADQQLGQLLDAVDQSESNWLVLMTTDHGRDILGCGHGAQTENEKSIFIASNKPLNDEFNHVVTDHLSNTDFDGLYGNPAQASITPTVLRYLGVEPKAEWNLDGLPLFGKVGVRKLLPGGGNNDFSWYANGNGPVDIYRNGTFLAQVDALQRGFTDSAEINGIYDYVLVKNDTPVSLRMAKVNITAAMDWNAFTAYLFRSDGRYVRYNKTLDKTESGYPRTVEEGNWPGLGQYAAKISAGFSKDLTRSYFFLNDGTYIRYNNTLDKADSGYPQPINNSTWPGLGAYATQISATLRWTGNKVYFFLKNGNYLRYDLVNDRVDSGYPKPINDSTWPGLGAYATQITSAVKWSDFKAYFFLTNQRYIRYSITEDEADSGYPARINTENWQGVLKP